MEGYLFGVSSLGQTPRRTILHNAMPSNCSHYAVDLPQSYLTAFFGTALGDQQSLVSLNISKLRLIVARSSLTSYTDPLRVARLTSRISPQISRRLIRFGGSTTSPMFSLQRNGHRSPSSCQNVYRTGRLAPAGPQGVSFASMGRQCFERKLLTGPSQHITNT